MTWEIELYQTPQGGQPVARVIAGLRVNLRAKLVRDIDLLGNFGLELGNPYIKKLRGTSGNIWELRTRLGSDQVRTLFSIVEGRNIILLHCFVKKTQRIPRKEIKTAEQRLKRVPRRT